MEMEASGKLKTSKSLQREALQYLQSNEKELIGVGSVPACSHGKDVDVNTGSGGDIAIATGFANTVVSATSATGTEFLLSRFITESSSMHSDLVSIGECTIFCNIDDRFEFKSEASLYSALNRDLQ